MTNSDLIVIIFVAVILILIAGIYFIEMRIKRARARLRYLDDLIWKSAGGKLSANMDKLEPFEIIFEGPDVEFPPMPPIIFYIRGRRFPPDPVDIDQLVAEIDAEYKRTHPKGGGND